MKKYKLHIYEAVNNKFTKLRIIHDENDVFVKAYCQNFAEGTKEVDVEQIVGLNKIIEWKLVDTFTIEL